MTSPAMMEPLSPIDRVQRSSTTPQAPSAERPRSLKFAACSTCQSALLVSVKETRVAATPASWAMSCRKRFALMISKFAGTFHERTRASAGAAKATDKNSRTAPSACGRKTTPTSKNPRGSAFTATFRERAPTKPGTKEART